LGYGHEIVLGSGITNWQKNLLTDPQTSGGLLVACSPEVEQEVLDLFIQDGFTQAKKVGIFEPGSGVTVL
jgi:selenide,water dikinase